MAAVEEDRAAVAASAAKKEMEDRIKLQSDKIKRLVKQVEKQTAGADASLLRRRSSVWRMSHVWQKCT